MKKNLTFLIALILSNTLVSQNETLERDEKARDRYGIGFIPSSSKNIYGIAIGPIGSESMCDRPYTRHSHGLNLQIPGQGFLMTPIAFKFINLQESEPRINLDSLILQDTMPPPAIHNGLVISPLGTFTSQVNGASLSLYMSSGKKINGFSFNLLLNAYQQLNGMSVGFVNNSGVTKGIQVGLINRTVKLKGFQIGLWNTNEKRSLPLINWSF